jgi:hypothetical protein
MRIGVLAAVAALAAGCHGASAPPSRVSDVQGSWRIVRYELPVPLESEAGQIAIALVGHAGVDVRGRALSFDWGGPQPVGTLADDGESLRIVDADPNDALFANATLVPTADGRWRVRRGDLVLTLERSASARAKHALCLSRDRLALERRTACVPGELRWADVG